MRKIVYLRECLADAKSYDVLYIAVCDDGTRWRMTVASNGDVVKPWTRDKNIPEIPQTLRQETTLERLHRESVDTSSMSAEDLCNILDQNG